MKNEVSKEEKEKQELHSVVPESIYGVVANRQANTYEAYVVLLLRLLFVVLMVSFFLYQNLRVVNPMMFKVTRV